MEYKPLKPAGRNIKKILLITLGSIILVGGIGYSTIIILRQIKAPTISNNSKIQTPSTNTPALSAEEALKIADTAYGSATKKVAAGDQKAALGDYKIAYENYKIAKNTTRANDAQFAIESIEAVLAVKENPIKPGVAKTSAKEQ